MLADEPAPGRASGGARSPQPESTLSSAVHEEVLGTQKAAGLAGRHPRRNSGSARRDTTADRA
jgi:hypothetical protein